MSGFRARRSSLLALVVGASLLTGTASAGVYDLRKVAGAVVDECYNGLGNPYVPYLGACPNGTAEKKNQAYPWSLVRRNNKVYVGTGGNVACFAFAASSGGIGIEVPGVQVCEGGMSQFPLVPFFIVNIMGDWRPPRVYRYDIAGETQTDMTPTDPLLALSMGLRASGIGNDVLLMAGPTIYGIGTTWFAWHEPSGQYLGSWSTRTWSNVRRMVSHNGQLYIGVQNTTGGTGSILRWTGNALDPFSFEVVGRTDNDVAYLIVHQNRLVCSTWPPSPLGSALGLGGGTDFPSGAVYVSPSIPPSGLRGYHMFFWRKVFSIDDYEPDPVIAKTYLVGDLLSLGDWVVFGTMQPAGGSRRAIVAAYPDADLDPDTAAAAERSFAVFRIRDLGWFQTPDVDLLYGAAQLPAYDPVGGWSQTPNNLGGVAPMHGPAGFGYPSNHYFWSTAKALGKGFVGTLDINFGPPTPTTGADLWCFADANSPAVPVDLTGLGNPLNQGARNMLGLPDRLFVGLINQANLTANGGWSLVEVTED